MRRSSMVDMRSLLSTKGEQSLSGMWEHAWYEMPTYSSCLCVIKDNAVIDQAREPGLEMWWRPLR